MNPYTESGSSSGFVCNGILGTLVVPSMEGLGKCKDISRVVEVDSMEGLMVSVVQPYWLHRVCKLKSDDNVIR